MKRSILFATFALLLALGGVGRASAHADLASSTPAAGGRLSAAPTTVTLVFNEEISETDSSFTVTDGSGATVGTGKLDLNDLDRKTLTGTLKSGLANGVYSVAWKTITPDDNGLSEGSFTFGINADPGAQPTAAPHNDGNEAAATAAPAATTAATSAATSATSAPAATTIAGGTAALPSTGSESMPIVALLIIAAVIVTGGVFLLKRGAQR